MTANFRIPLFDHAHSAKLRDPRQSLDEYRAHFSIRQRKYFPSRRPLSAPNPSFLSMPSRRKPTNRFGETSTRRPANSSRQSRVIFAQGREIFQQVMEIRRSRDLAIKGRPCRARLPQSGADGKKPCAQALKPLAFGRHSVIANVWRNRAARTDGIS